MHELLRAVLAHATLPAIMLAVAGVAALWWAWAAVSPRTLVLALLAAVFVFEGGAAAVDEATGRIASGGFNLYGKGGSVLLFSFFEISVMAAGLAAWVRRPLSRAFGPAAPALRGLPGTAPQGVWGVGHTMAMAYLMLAGVVLWHIGQSLAAPLDAAAAPAHWLSQLGRPGVLHLLLQGLLVAAIVAVAQSERELRAGMAMLMALVALRMAWGALRYLLLGGDPRSAYELEGGSALRITFWDVNDSVLACALGAWALWHAAHGSSPLPRASSWAGRPPARALLLVAALGCFAVAALSGRRTAQGGAALALLSLLFLLPRGRRWPAAVALALALPLAAWKLRDRIDDGSGVAASLGTLTRSALESPQAIGDPRYQRFHELELAWETVRRQPLLGVGPAGAFDVPSPRGLEYHKGNYGFVHSGFGHVLLKTGFVGLAMFVCILGCSVWAAWRQWRRGPAASRDLLAVAVTGLAASLPTLWVGTPVIEIRTMMLLGFFMALPLAAARMHSGTDGAGAGAGAGSASAVGADIGLRPAMASSLR